MTYKDIIKLMEKTPAFIPMLGIKITNVEPGYCEGELEVREELNNPMGTVHGGCIFSLADTVGGMAAIAHNPDAKVVTLSSNINYLRPAVNTKKLYARTREIKYGSQIALYEVIITNDDGIEIVNTNTTYFIKQ